MRYSPDTALELTWEKSILIDGKVVAKSKRRPDGSSAW
jgi:hypothetical protein